MASHKHIDPLLDEARWKLGLRLPTETSAVPVGRGAKILMFAAVLALAAAGLSRALPRDEYRCSAQLADSDYFGPAAAFDGDATTFFALPDNEPGELEAHFADPRFATAVVVHQPRDRRGVRTLRLTVNGADPSPELTATGPSLRWDLPEPTDVEAIRLEILRWRGPSGAIGEVEFAIDAPPGEAQP